MTKVLSQPFFRINGVPEVASSEISRNFTKILRSNFRPFLLIS
ncbi:hypothetical protein HMPREF0352_1689 [Enterococcus faecium TX1330]|nr:hypothetical protein HMPREF0352_1689 [Enterococcus faecium TX1330]